MLFCGCVSTWLIIVAFIYQFSNGFVTDPIIRKCNEKVHLAKEVLQNCPKFREIWNMINPVVDCTRGLVRTAASVSPLKRIIINADRSADRSGFSSYYEDESYITQITMELINLKHNHSHYLKNMCDMDVNEYALEYEKREYDSVVETNEILIRCFKHEMRENWRQLFLNYSDLESYLKVQEGTGHTDFYRFYRLTHCNRTRIGDVLNWVHSNRKKWRHEIY